MANTNNDKQVGASVSDGPVIATPHAEAPKMGPPSAAPQKAELDGVDQEVDPRDALRRLLPELEAIPVSQLKQISVDVDSAVATVLGCLSKVKALRPAIVEALPKFDLTLFDKVEDYTTALNAAQGLYVAAIGPENKLLKLLEEALALRDIFVSEATTLVRRGLLHPSSIDDLKGPNGHKNLASDLNHLVVAFQNQWSTVSNKTTVTDAELGRAVRLQLRILRLLGERKENETSTNAASDLRTRAFTRFIQAWDDVRCVVSHLRWKMGDVDDFAPSLYAGRGGTKRKGTELPPVVVDTTPPDGSTQGAGQGPTPPSPLPAPGKPQGARAPTAGLQTPKADADPGDDPFLA